MGRGQPHSHGWRCEVIIDDGFSMEEPVPKEIKARRDIYKVQDIQECPLMGGDKHLKLETMHINAHKTSERDLLLQFASLEVVKMKQNSNWRPPQL